MAYTVTTIRKTVHGNERVAHFQVAADANSGAVSDTGMGFADCVAFSPVSMSSASEPKFKVNLNASAATANGTIFVSGVTSGDVFFLTVYGR